MSEVQRTKLSLDACVAAVKNLTLCSASLQSNDSFHFIERKFHALQYVCVRRK